MEVDVHEDIGQHTAAAEAEHTNNNGNNNNNDDPPLVLRFCKMHGCANDFVIFHIDSLRNELTQQCIVPSLPDLQRIARFLCNRSTGVGADHVLVITPPPAHVPEAQYQMLIFNADGSMAENCGNGIRCLTKFIIDYQVQPYNTGEVFGPNTLHLQQHLRPFYSSTVLQPSRATHSPYSSFKPTIHSIYTIAGVMQCCPLPSHPHNTAKTLWVKVCMGKPLIVTTADNIQAYPPLSTSPSSLPKNHMIPFKGHFINSTLVSMGNPHCVVHLENVEEFPMDYYGEVIESHPIFPEKTNVEFAEVLSRSLVRAKVWQRGCGTTYACGTGACAVVVAGVLRGKNDRKATVQMDGGDLEVEWREEDDVVFHSGPATTTYAGTIRFFISEIQ
eukprot:gene4386-5132_t